MLYRNCIFIVFAFASCLLQAQFNNLKFENIATGEGLSSSTCTEIFQDSDGFLWFGTIDGLNRYNGYEFEIYRSILNDSTSISNNRINAITEDDYGNLWVATNNGLNLFNKETNTFSHVNLQEQRSLSNSPRKIVNDLLYDTKRKTLWVATNNGAIQIRFKDNPLQPKNLAYSYYLNDASNPRSIDDNKVNSLSKDSENTIWCATNGPHLNRYNFTSDDFDKIYIDNAKPYELNHIPKKVLVDSDDDFWIGNDLSNLVLWTKKDNTFEHLSLVNYNTPISSIQQSQNGTIWVSTDGHGLFLIDKTKKEIQQHIVNNIFDPSSLPNNKPSMVYEDNSGVFWIGSYDKGVSMLDPSKYSFGHYYYQPDNPKGLNERIVQAVLQDSKERIWLGAYNGGLNLFDEENKSYEHYSHDANNANSLSSNKIMYCFESSDGMIWVCTLDGGLNSFDPERSEFTRFKHNANDSKSIGQNSVWTGVEDVKKRLWLGLRTEGLSLFDPKTQTFKNYKNTLYNKNRLASNSILCLYIDSKNRLLVGTALGLNVVELDKLESYVPEEINFGEVSEKGIEGTGINYIMEDHVGNIWLGTDNGIAKLDANLKPIKTYSSQNGLPNNLVVGIAEDNNNNFWITTKSGLSFLDPQKHHFRNFNVHDGLQGTEYQSKSIDKTQDGRILVGGLNGFNIFGPDDIKSSSINTVRPQITSFKLNNKKIVSGDSVNGRVLMNGAVSQMTELRLEHNENYISFEFVALNFENPEQVQYAYKMQGLDDAFVNVGSTRAVNLSNLEPGNYSFEVKAAIDDQWENAESASINVTILPPIWKTWWMYLLYVVLGGSVLWVVINYYTHKVKESQQYELDQMKLQFFVNVSHEFRTPLTLILNPVDKILSTVGDSGPIKASAVTIQRSARRLLHLVNQLLDYRKMDAGMAPLQLEKGNMVKFCEDIFTLFKGLAEKKEIDYRFQADVKSITTLFDFDKVEKVFTNLISNAIKFTAKGGCITVSVLKGNKKTENARLFSSNKEKLDEYVEVRVEDNGVGLNAEQSKNIFSRFYNLDLTKSGTGIGLNFTKALVEQHDGEILVESEHKKGSTFSVRFPLNVRARLEAVENVKNEFLINSVNAVEYEMSIANEVQSGKKQHKKVIDPKLPTLLIVEDNKELRMHLIDDLKDTYNIRAAANGEKGLRLAKKYSPDIIISDVMMPKMDGFELCKRIKSEFDTSHIPVLLLTAKSQDVNRITGYDSGADAYLSKPFMTSVLKARISNLLEAKNRLKKRFSEIGGIFPSNEITSNNIDEVFLDKATKIILENVSDMEFKQEHLLTKMGIGRSQLYRKINSLTGNNPSYFIRTIRLRYASELLQQNGRSIKEVSYMTGFNSTAYFSKTFKELFDMTPSEFVMQRSDTKIDVEV